MPSINLRLTPGTYLDVRDAAEADGRSIQKELECAIREFLDRRKRARRIPTQPTPTERQGN